MGCKIELPTELKAVNVGLEVFANDLRLEGVEVIHLDWRPPAGGDTRLAGLLASLCNRE